MRFTPLLLGFGMGVSMGALALGCSSSNEPSGSGGSTIAGASTVSGSTSASTSPSTVSASGTTAASSSTGASGSSGSGGASPIVDALDQNRDRLIKSYLDYLQASVTVPQSNGLSGGNVSSVCDVWSKLDPSSQAVFLTLTERLQASLLGSDHSSMLFHIQKVYRIAGGENATLTDPGSCGGGEFNRMIMSMDAELQSVQVLVNDHQGALQANNLYDIADAPPHGTFWRDSHDLGGPHGPFDLSDETDQGAPRGQAQFFHDPTSSAATAPLGRQDLTTLVDPYALEMDQDYDCLHNSNPVCTYTTYGPFCLPEAAEIGTQIFAASYGDYQPNWKPSGC